MKLTINEFHEYSEIAKRVFAFMNGKINILNNRCSISIEMYDFLNKTYANIRYPNNITIYIGTIIDSWIPSWEIYLNKKDYIGTCIAWALSHELHHADQLISMVQYNRNSSYKTSVEEAVELASYNWVNINKIELSQVGGFNVIIDKLDSNTLPKNKKCDYRKATVKEYYLQTIANVLLRDLDVFVKLRAFTNDEEADDIILCFSDHDKIIIKENGEYLIENVNRFSNLVYIWAGYYDTYSVAASTTFMQSGNKTIAYVRFDFSDRLINGMVFKERR